MSLNKILQEIRSWRALPSQRERLNARPLDKEDPDKTPVAIPVGFGTPQPMTELIQQYVRQAVSQQASADGLGTFDEEDDFELEDNDPLPMEQYEVNEYSMEEDPEMPSTEDASAEAPAAPAAPPAEAGNEGEKPSDNPT